MVNFSASNFVELWWFGEKIMYAVKTTDKRNVKFVLKLFAYEPHVWLQHLMNAEVHPNRKEMQVGWK